jgi:hypothetical protein
MIPNSSKNIIVVLVMAMIFFFPEAYGQNKIIEKPYGLRTSPVSYYMSFDDRSFFDEDFIELSGKKKIEERKIGFPEGRFGKGIQMNLIPVPPDADNMTGIDLDLVTAVVFNTRPGNKMGYNQPFIWGSGRINPRLGSVAFWAKGHVPFAGPLFEQTSISFGRTERDLLGVVIGKDNKISAYVRDARYVRHEINSDYVWDTAAWNHVVMNWDWANGMELWINGESVASSWGSDGWFETMPPGLFHLPAPGVTYDELYLMDRPISKSEIEALRFRNAPPEEERTVYTRKNFNSQLIRELSGADKSDDLPVVSPDSALVFSEVWPADAADGHIPGWHIIDGRNEIAWPHPYAVFTIIPGDGDFHAEKVDIKTPPGSTVNYIALTGNLTNVKVQSSGARTSGTENLLQVPSGNRFFYGAVIKSRQGASFTIPFTEKYGTPPGFSGDINLPLSGEKRIQDVGFYHYKTVASRKYIPEGNKLILGARTIDLEKRTAFAMHALTSRDERKILIADQENAKSGAGIIDIGAFGRLNILTSPFNSETAISAVTLSLPVKTEASEEVLFVRVRDPAVPSRLWNQFAVKLNGFHKSFQNLVLTIDFQDIVVTGGDRLWIDLGTLGKTEIKTGDKKNPAGLFVSTMEVYRGVDAYIEKEILPAKGQYSKQYEFMPWQFTGRKVSIEDPYCYGGPFDMLLPALAINRIKPDHFVANYMIRMAGPDFKDGHRIHPEKTALINLTDENGAPDWAVYMRNYNKKRWKMVDWWVKQQNKDGQIGGGWNDDVLFLSFHQADIPLDGHAAGKNLIDSVFKGLEKTHLFKDGFCNIYPMDRMHTGDFISERYNTVVNNLGQAYAAEREMESAWHLGKPEQTPINYYADGFKSSANVFNWYWGKDIPKAPYISKPLKAITEDLRLYASVFDDYYFYRMTESRVMTDDFRPYGANSLYTYMLGGERGSRLDAHLKLAAIWPSGAGPEVSRLILKADDTSLEGVLYSFDSKLRDVKLRLTRILDGRYRIGLYLDKDGQGTAGNPVWSTEMDLTRFDIINLPVPPQKPVVLKIEQIESNDRPAELADLAIDSWEAEKQGGNVSATIHNLGNAVAENIVVRLLDGAQVIQEKVIAYLGAPTDFVAKRMKILFNNVPVSSTLQVVIDPDNKIREILEENNKAAVH